MDKQQEIQIIPDEVLLEKIHQIRQQKVMLDSDLAELYGVQTKRLKEQIRRNIERFPDKYMFELTESEFAVLRPHFATTKEKRGGSRYLNLLLSRNL